MQARGYQPARADVPALFALLEAGEREDAELAERALARLGHAAAVEARRRFDDARPPARGRLCKLIGRLATSEGEARGFLLAAVEDSDPKTRRNAVIALGKLAGDDVRQALERRWDQTEELFERRSLAAALGKVGGPGALERLRALATDDAELRRIAAEAVLKLERTLGRKEALGHIDEQAAPLEPLPVVLHCRHGLSQIVAAELTAAFGARVVDEETVAATLSGPLASLWAARAALRFAFPLPVSERDVGRAVVQALTSAAAARVLTAFTRGPARYRLEWAGAGHRRGLTFRVAAEIKALRPELVNDPTQSLWEAVVREAEGRPSVELWPRGLDDPRFDYRVAQVPASSHPTVAAALAHVAGARPDDVVWDPFVGAGTELIERARKGPFRTLVGTDLDEAALELARQNLHAAQVQATLAVGDARSYKPSPRPTLVLTNPPLGRRVLNKQLTGALYDAFLQHAAEVLAPGGRLVWMSPRPHDTAKLAQRLGLRPTLRQRVDMAGFWAEMQAFTKKTT